MSIRIVISAVCLLLGACSSEPEVKPTNGETETQLEKSMSTQLDALEEAKAVEQQLLEGAQKRKAQIDAQGG